MRKQQLVLIPARGGSRGIPYKNLKRVGDFTLLERAIRNAKAAGFRWVIVSTDDPHVDKAAMKCGASVLREPAELATDDASMDNVIRYAIQVIGEEFISEIILLQCTSPMTTPQDIVGAHEKFQRLGVDSLFSAYALYPYLWKPNLRPLYDPAERKLRQDKEPYWLENGAIYIFKPHILRAGGRIGGDITVWPMDTWIEIDEPGDVEVAEWMLKKRQNFVGRQSSEATKSSSAAMGEAQPRHPTLRQSLSARGCHALL